MTQIEWAPELEYGSKYPLYYGTAAGPGGLNRYYLVRCFKESEPARWSMSIYSSAEFDYGGRISEHPTAETAMAAAQARDDAWVPNKALLLKQIEIQTDLGYHEAVADMKALYAKHFGSEPC